MAVTILIKYQSTADWQADRQTDTPMIDSTPCLKKQSKLFSSELRQISINLDNFWQKDGQDDEIMWGALIFHLT